MSISLLMAWRNLWRNRRRTWLTVCAMVFSNVILVFMISLQLGSYQMMIDNTLHAFTGHLQIQHRGFNDEPKLRSTVPAIAELAATLRKELASQQISARAIGFALASSEERSYGLQLIGVQPDYEPLISTLPGLIHRGRYFTDNSASEIIIGVTLARNLRVDIGDEITLLGSGLDGSFAAGVATVVGIFESGMPDVDRSMAQLPLGYFQAVFAMDDQGHSIVIKAPDLFQVSDLQLRAQAALADNSSLAVLNWELLLPGLKQAIQADFTSAWFMYTILVVLVSFSVLNTQLMSVLERTREFGTMMALGVGPKHLARLIALETFLMAALGLALGVAGGLLVTLYMAEVGFSYPGMEQMTERFNLPPRMYPVVSLLSVVMGPSVVFLGSLLASLYPALRLFYLQPIQAMRAV